MSSLLTPQAAFDYAKIYLKNMPLEKVGARTLDDVNKIMWMAAPWRWTLGSMPTIQLSSSTQDYGITVPADFLFLIKAYLTDGTTAPRELKIEPTLPGSVGYVGQPNQVALVGNSFRLLPKPGTVPTTPQTLISLYKKQAPLITTQTMATPGVQVFDDEWFWVFQEGVLWRAYQFGDDSRAGTAEVSNSGQIKYTGQRAVFEAALDFMKQSEKLLDLKPEKA